MNKRWNRICQTNDGFDSNGVLDLSKKNRWVLNERWIRICQKNYGFDNKSVLDLREKKDGFRTSGGIEFAKKMMGLIVMVYWI